MPTLENDLLSVAIQSKGAELTRIYHRPQGREYLWSGDPAVWGRHAPILFPIVGALRDNTYRFQGQGYTLRRHGFARNLPFELISQDEKQVVFELESTADTRAHYPFAFRLQVGYTLDGARLRVTWLVTNADDEAAMWFSIGAHPAFALKPDDRVSDYLLWFDHPERADRHLLGEGGLFDGRTELAVEGESLPLDARTFDRDALVFTDLRSERLTLRNRLGDHRVELRFPGFPYFGVWAPAGTDAFVCLEPWHGLADAHDAPGDLTEKRGIRSLAAGETFRAYYDILVGPEGEGFGMG
ncbi:MAG: aldose 1-epimerase family protein [Catalinimonas sp.]